ncbi:MAG: MATE family efflux transporter [Crocinitomicaceae bacterium]
MLELTYRRILIITLPLMFGTFVQSVITITDASFVSELGNTAYNAVGQGGMMYIALFMLSQGLADGTQITIAKKYGEQDFSAVGRTLFTAHILQFLLALFIFFAFIFLADILILKIAKSEAIGEAMITFLQYRSWGIFFAALQVSMVAFFIGLGKTNIIIISTLILAVCNIVLDYGLIFGNFGCPELGLKGAAIASSCSEAISFLFLLIYASKAGHLQKFQFSIRQKFDFIIAKKLMFLSTPLMFQSMLALSTWLVFFSMIEHIGHIELEISHNIRYMYFIAFVPIFGFAAATKTYVSYLVGRKNYKAIPPTLFKIMLLSLLSILLLFHGALLYPETLIGIVAHNPDASAEVIQKSAEALQFVSGSIFLFALVIVPFHAISALGRTGVSFTIELISVSTYLLACYLFIELWQWDIVNIWTVEYIYFSVIGLISTVFVVFYMRRFKT